MNWLRRNGGGGRVAKKVAIDVVESLAKEGAKDALKRLPEFCLCVAEQGWPYAAAAFAGCVPVVGSALALGGIAIYKHRKENKNDADERAHYRALAEALRDIAHDQKATIEKLTALGEQRPFVWTDVQTEDPAVAAAQVTAAFRAAGFDGTVTVQDLMGEIRAVRQGVDRLEQGVSSANKGIEAIRQDQATKDDLVAMEQRIREMFEENKKSATDPTQQEWPPELIEQAKILRERGDKEQKAVAEIALRNHDTADRLIQELKTDPIAEAFRLLTLEGDNWYQANEPDKAIGPYEQALALRPDDITARNNATLAYSFARLGDVTTHRRRAIELAEHTLTKLDPATTAWAMTQANLGTAWQSMPTGNRAANLGRAIEAYERALTVYTKPAHPDKWAGTKNNLGNAWARMPTGDRSTNLGRAIEAYEQALMVRTNAVQPTDWAMTQNNLGNAWAEMLTGDRAANLGRAIEAYELALTVFTKTAHPDKWAGTQNNLGLAWGEMPTGDHAANLGRAIDAYELALTVYTKPAHPAEWAMTQNNLGVAWSDIPTGEPAANLGRAIEAYEQALTVYTKAAHPSEWAMTQNNLGTVWRGMPTGEPAANLERAIEAYEQALTVYTKTAHPADWAMTQNNLGNAWQSMPTGDRAANLERAIEAYEQALAVRTKAARPADWATTQNNLGIAWADLAAVPGQDACDCLRRSIRASKGALTVYLPEAFPLDHADVAKNLEIDREAYESLGCTVALPFDDIPPAE